MAFGHFLQCSHQKIGVPTEGTTHSLEVALNKSVSKINAMSYKICKRCHLYFFFLMSFSIFFSWNFTEVSSVPLATTRLFSK